ncbi:MAG: hypothetical protein RL227_1013 [Pseudomonadota bacterium]
MVLLVRGQSPFQRPAQKVTMAKTRPVRDGTSGIGSANHLFGEMLKLEGQAPEHDHAPHQGSAPAMQDLFGGQIDGVFVPITTNVAQPKAGSLRALAVSTPARLPALPNIPTFTEQGFPSMTGSQGLGLPGPKTLPPKTPVPGDDFVKLARSQIDTWTQVARRAKVEVKI